ncbi:MAG: 6-carboxytetrahydropterin synthase [Bacteroidota bacterium]
MRASTTHHFSSAHKLYNPAWSQQKNEEVFGPCANENWHGHNFTLIVSVKGFVSEETGRVIDPTDLNDIVRTNIIEKVDHKNLNLDVDFMQGKMGSCENLVIEFWKILKKEVEELALGMTLDNLELWETPRNYVTYQGD